MADAIRVLLAPRARLLTPNREELRRLAPEADSLAARARALLAAGAECVYVTGADDARGAKVTHHLFLASGAEVALACERLPGAYHGSGCTLAAATAGLLAHGVDPVAAVHEAQEFTWQSLKHGHRLGMGQYLPNRFFWALSGEEETQ